MAYGRVWVLTGVGSVENGLLEMKIVWGTGVLVITELTV